MTTWSAWIDSDKANPHGLETEQDGEGHFRVRIRPDGVSDWITHRGDLSPVAGDVKVSVRYATGFGGLDDVLARWVYWEHVIRFRLHGTPEPEVKPAGRYMVSVDGMPSPKKEHETLESAIAEAQRVAMLPANLTRTVRVLQVVATLPPVSERQVVMAGEGA